MLLTVDIVNILVIQSQTSFNIRVFVGDLSPISSRYGRLILMPIYDVVFEIMHEK